MVGGDRSRASSEDVDPVAVDAADGREQAAVVGEGGGDEPLGVAEVGGLSGGGEEGLAELGVPGLALGDTEPDGEVECEQRIGVIGLVVEVEGLGVVAARRRRGRARRARRRRLGGCSRPPLAGRRVGGRAPVAGQLTDARPGPVPARDVLERFGDLAVGAGLAGAAQLVVQVCWMSACTKV